LDGTQREKGATLIFDANYEPKPADRAVLHAFGQTLKSNPEMKDERLRFEQRAAQYAAPEGGNQAATPPDGEN